MTSDLETILANLGARVNQPQDYLKSPYLYLDPEAVAYLFAELTGLKDPPRLRRARADDGQTRGPRLEPSLEADSGPGPPVHLLFEAMAPVVAAKVPRAARGEDLESLAHCYARVQGLLQGTHFPDGELNLEIQFAGVRGLLFYTKAFFSSLLRPLLVDDRFHTIFCEVEALVYVHGRVQRQIFYHQTYGDNKEHDWVPIVPVAIQEAEAAGGECGWNGP